MELRNFAQIGIHTRVTAVPSFNLQVSPCKTYYIQLRERQFEINYVNYTTDEDVTDKFTLSRCVLDYPSDWPTEYLSMDVKRVFDSLTENNYVDVVLDGKWCPSVYRIKPSTTPLKITFSEQINGKIFVAVLMSHGAFHLYRKERENWIDCCNIGSEHVDLVKGSKKVSNNDDLQEVLGFAEIVSFVWLEPKEDELHLLWITKNGSVYSGLFNANTEDLNIHSHSITLPDPYSVEVIKQNPGDDHLLLVSTSGDVSMYRINFTSIDNISIDKTIDLWTDSDHISVNCITHQFHDNGLRIYIVKGFFLVIFELNTKLKLENTIIERFSCPFITGLKLIDDHQFIITLVNQKVLYGILMRGKITLVEVQNEFDPNFSCSGVTFGHNKAIWTFTFTASKPNDYTALKQPQRIVFATLSQLSPSQLVLDDTERRISHHLDYFEMIRAKKASTTHEFSKLQERIEKSGDNLEEVEYWLKVQWFLLQVSMKIKNVKDKESEAKTSFVEHLIMAIRYHKSLEALVDIKVDLNKEQLTAVSNLRTFLTTTLQSSNNYDHSSLVKRLQLLFNGTIEKSKLIRSDVKPEMCGLCDGPMIPGQLKCVQLHKFNRCCYTYLQVPTMTTERCSICHKQCLSVDKVNAILGTSITRTMCSTCDSGME